MKYFHILIIGFITLKTQGQCSINPNILITGSYTADINFPPGSLIHVTNTGTVTGNIYLNDSWLCNSGTILSKTIRMKQTTANSIFLFENHGVIKCDSMMLDSLGHFHNEDSLTTKYFIAKHGSDIDNSYVFEAKTMELESKTHFTMNAPIKTDYLYLRNQGTYIYNAYSTIQANKLLLNDTGAVIFGTLFACVDSCFINKGTISNQVQPTWSPSIRVNGLSINQGTINNIDFCDLSSTLSGGLDVNSGVLNSVSFCSSNQNFCTNVMGIEKNLSDELPFRLYPNPASSVIHVEGVIPNDCSITILNSMGTPVLESPFKGEISIEGLSNGIYVLVLKEGKRVSKKKFVVLK